MKLIAHSLVALISCLFLSQAFAVGKIEMNEYMVQSDTPCISLYVRNKHLVFLDSNFKPEK